MLKSKSYILILKMALLSQTPLYAMSDDPDPKGRTLTRISPLERALDPKLPQFQWLPQDLQDMINVKLQSNPSLQFQELPAELQDRVRVALPLSPFEELLSPLQKMIFARFPMQMLPAMSQTTVRLRQVCFELLLEDLKYQQMQRKKRNAEKDKKSIYKNLNLITNFHELKAAYRAGDFDLMPLERYFSGFQGYTTKIHFQILQNVVDAKDGETTYTPEEIFQAQSFQAVLRAEKQVSDKEMTERAAFQILAKASLENSSPLSVGLADYFKARLRLEGAVDDTFLSSDQTYDIFQRLSEEAILFPKKLKDAAKLSLAALRVCRRVHDNKITLQNAFHYLTKLISDEHFSLSARAAFLRCLLRGEQNIGVEEMSDEVLFRELEKLTKAPLLVKRSHYRLQNMMAKLRLDDKISEDLFPLDKVFSLLRTMLVPDETSPVTSLEPFHLSLLQYFQKTLKNPEECLQDQELYRYSSVLGGYLNFPITPEEEYHYRLVRLSLLLTGKVADPNRSSSIRDLQVLLKQPSPSSLEDKVRAAQLYLDQPEAAHDQDARAVALVMLAQGASDSATQIKYISEFVKENRFSVAIFSLLMKLETQGVQLSEDMKHQTKILILTLCKNFAKFDPERRKALNAQVYETLGHLSSDLSLSENQKLMAKFLQLVDFFKGVTTSHSYMKPSEKYQALAHLCKNREWLEENHKQALLKYLETTFTKFNNFFIKNIDKKGISSVVDCLYTFSQIILDKSEVIGSEAIQSYFAPLVEAVYNQKRKLSRESHLESMAGIRNLIKDERLQKAFKTSRVVPSERSVAHKKYLEEFCPEQPLPPPSAAEFMDTREVERGERRLADPKDKRKQSSKKAKK